MNFVKYLSLARKEKQPGGIKAERTYYSVNQNPSTLQPGQMLLIKTPSSAANTLIVPGFMKLVFNINITGGTDSWFVNNLSANLINTIQVKWGTKSVLNINYYDVLSTYQDLWLTFNQTANSIKSCIQSTI